MYNGIGLQTSRGSGTNGYVQRNLSFVRVSKEKVEYKQDEEIKKLESYINRKGNAELLKHDRKRKIELKCVEMEEMMTEQGYSEEEIQRKVEKFRKQLLEKESQREEVVDFEFDEYGRPVANESHKQAEANDLKNKKLREAFGLGEFDPSVRAKQLEEERQLRDQRAKEMLNKNYKWVDEDDLNDDADDEESYSQQIRSRKLASEVVQIKKPTDTVMEDHRPEKESNDKKERHNKDKDSKKETDLKRKKTKHRSRSESSSDEEKEKKHKRRNEDNDDRRNKRDKDVDTSRPKDRERSNRDEEKRRDLSPVRNRNPDRRDKDRYRSERYHRESDNNRRDDRRAETRDYRSRNEREEPPVKVKDEPRSPEESRKSDDTKSREASKKKDTSSRKKKRSSSSSSSSSSDSSSSSSSSSGTSSSSSSDSSSSSSPSSSDSEPESPKQKTKQTKKSSR